MLNWNEEKFSITLSSDEDKRLYQKASEKVEVKESRQWLVNDDSTIPHGGTLSVLPSTSCRRVYYFKEGGLIVWYVRSVRKETNYTPLKRDIGQLLEEIFAMRRGREAESVSFLGNSKLYYILAEMSDEIEYSELFS